MASPPCPRSGFSAIAADEPQLAHTVFGIGLYLGAVGWARLAG
jgi:hypothetical protein